MSLDKLFHILKTYDYDDFSILKGKIIKKIEFIPGRDNEPDETENEGIIFTMDNDEKYRLCYDPDGMQDGCDVYVYLKEIIGDINDIIDKKILHAECSTNESENNEICFSQTWTFYRILTIDSDVTIVFFGESNGFYSEVVDFQKIGD